MSVQLSRAAWDLLEDLGYKSVLNPHERTARELVEGGWAVFLSGASSVLVSTEEGRSLLRDPS